MTTLKMREDINLLEVENIFFLLLHRNVATGLSLFVGYEIDMTFFFHLFAYILGSIHPVHHIIQVFGR